MKGRIVAIHAKRESPGERGFPKPSVEAATVEREGLVGDFNRHRQEKRAGEAAQAVLLHTREELAAIRADGWPVAPGDLGENVLVEGVPYASFAPGTRWIAGGVGLEISKACAPCAFLYALPYVGDERGPSFLKATLGRRGWYARVLRPGRIRVGDPVAPDDSPI